MPKATTLQRVETISAENLYTLSITHQKKKTRIYMQLHIPHVTTRHFPMTKPLLELYVPSIFRSICYNDDKLPFHKEVARTELGHLFEHILLEYLCIIKLESGLDTATYEGVTDWNWIRDPKGTFRITIHMIEDEVILFTEALTRTITLMNIILTKDKAIQSPLPIPAGTTRH